MHDPVAALDYAGRLAPLADAYADRLKIVMRVYFEKPRTTVGWKGLINDPGMDGSFDVETGHCAPRVHCCSTSATLGLPVGCEFLEPTSPQYIADTVAWGAIGARTTESQIHRQLASGLSMPVGFKNGTDGNIQVAIDGVESRCGAACLLRYRRPRSRRRRRDVGQSRLPRDPPRRLRRARTTTPTRWREPSNGSPRPGCPRNVMIDCSHANSDKDHLRQAEVADEMAARIACGERGISGLMLESFLVAGAQSLGGELVYGQSVTDKCMDFATTAEVLARLHDAKRQSRRLRR